MDRDILSPSRHTPGMAWSVPSLMPSLSRRYRTDHGLKGSTVCVKRESSPILSIPPPIGDP